MDKTEFLSIYGTFENLAVVKQTLPSIIEETKQNDARLIVHDSSVDGRQEKWDYLLELNKHQDFHLILSDNMSMAHARNMCLHLGQELFSPDYICMIEDDHGYKPGLISAMVDAMKQYYGKPAPNGLRYGLFTGCGRHNVPEREILEDGHAYPSADLKTGPLGGTNSCFRCAPTQHWQNVLKGYDTDEYLISVYQTVNLNYRNYNKGFTTLIVHNGDLTFDVTATGRGFTGTSELRLWDDNYTASDLRSKYLGKPDAGQQASTAATDSDIQDLLERGERLHAQGNYKEALEVFSKILKLNPNQPDALNNMIVMTWESGNVSQALSHIERALSVEPLHRLVTLNAASIMLALERPEEARRLCTRYLWAQPRDPEIQQLLWQLESA